MNEIKDYNYLALSGKPITDIQFAKEYDLDIATINTKHINESYLNKLEESLVAAGEDPIEISERLDKDRKYIYTQMALNGIT